MAAKITSTKGITPLSASIGVAGAAFKQAVRRLFVAIKHRRELRRLVDLDDRMLNDIGLKRNDLRDAHVVPLWQDPTMLLTWRAAEGPIGRPSEDETLSGSQRRPR